MCFVDCCALKQRPWSAAAAPHSCYALPGPVASCVRFFSYSACYHPSLKCSMAYYSALRLQFWQLQLTRGSGRCFIGNHLAYAIMTSMSCIDLNCAIFICSAEIRSRSENWTLLTAWRDCLSIRRAIQSHAAIPFAHCNLSPCLLPC